MEETEIAMADSGGGVGGGGSTKLGLSSSDSGVATVKAVKAGAKDGKEYVAEVEESVNFVKGGVIVTYGCVSEVNAIVTFVNRYVTVAKSISKDVKNSVKAGCGRADAIN